MRSKRRSVFPVPSLPHTTISRVPSYFGDDNEFTHIHRSPLSHLRKVSNQPGLRSLFAMTSEDAPFSVVSLLHSNKIATLPRLEKLALSCNGADIDNLRAPFNMSVWKALDAREHQLSGRSFRPPRPQRRYVGICPTGSFAQYLEIPLSYRKPE